MSYTNPNLMAIRFVFSGDIKGEGEVLEQVPKKYDDNCIIWWVKLVKELAWISLSAVLKTS